MVQFDAVSALSQFKRDGSKLVKKNADEGFVYFVFAAMVVASAQMLSDRVFSAIITLGAAFQCLGFVLLRLKVRKQHGVQGISGKSLQLYAVALCCRLFSTLQFNGYLPVDRTGDWLYQLVDLVALGVVYTLIVMVRNTHNATYHYEFDTCSIGWFALGAFILSFFIHPHLNNRKIPDMAWTCALYIETVAMIPQLWMLFKMGGEVESLASHFIACVFMSRVLMMTFWVNTYHELRPKESDFNLPGFGVMGAQLLQCVIFADFMYYYVRSIRNNTKLVLPSSFAI
jgi:hypothetical protein